MSFPTGHGVCVCERVERKFTPTGVKWDNPFGGLEQGRRAGGVARFPAVSTMPQPSAVGLAAAAWFSAFRCFKRD